MSVTDPGFGISGCIGETFKIMCYGSEDDNIKLAGNFIIKENTSDDSNTEESPRRVSTVLTDRRVQLEQRQGSESSREEILRALHPKSENVYANKEL